MGFLNWSYVNFGFTIALFNIFKVNSKYEIIHDIFLLAHDITYKIIKVSPVPNTRNHFFIYIGFKIQYYLDSNVELSTLRSLSRQTTLLCQKNTKSDCSCKLIYLEYKWEKNWGKSQIFMSTSHFWHRKHNLTRFVNEMHWLE